MRPTTRKRLEAFSMQWWKHTDCFAYSCSANNAQCKNTCSTSYDACRSSGDSSLDAECLHQYDDCLVDLSAVQTKQDCASAYLECDGDDNTCLANLAQCKNTCAVARDTCQTSGDKALSAGCQKQYDSCLVDFTAAKTAIGEDCVAEYLSCDGADNTCSAGNGKSASWRHLPVS